MKLIPRQAELVRIRTEAGLTQRALALKAGISAPYMNQIETCGYIPGPTVAGKIANALDVKVVDIFKLTDGSSTDRERTNA